MCQATRSTRIPARCSLAGVTCGVSAGVQVTAGLVVTLLQAVFGFVIATMLIL